MSKQLLKEANFANSGKFKVEIKNELLNSFDDIYDYIMSKFVGPVVSRKENSDKMKQWFESNFKNWFKNDAVGYDQFDERWPTKDNFYKTVYVKTTDVIDDLQNEFDDMTREEILAQFPPFVAKNVESTTLFMGGRKIRFKSVGMLVVVEEVVDYMNAILNPTEGIEIPPDLQFKDISKVAVPDMLRRAVDMHVYLKRMAEKVDYAKAKQMYKGLEEGRDYKNVDLLEADGKKVSFILGKTGKFADVEGKWMKHCVGTYGRQVESGSVAIVACIDVEEGVSVATFELDPAMKNARQIKGKHNGPVAKPFHKVIWKFIVKHKISPGGDARNIGEKPKDEELAESRKRK